MEIRQKQFSFVKGGNSAGSPSTAFSKKSGAKEGLPHTTFIKSGVGFTLVELMISIAIFSALSLIIVGIYVAFSNTQWRTQAAQKVLNDSQYALEVMAREIRNSSVYYGNDTAACPSYDNCLRLQRPDNTIIAFYGNDNSTTLYYGVWDGVDDWSEVELINLHKIIDLSFFKEPENDPFAPNTVDHQQPKVTIKLEVQPETNKEVEKVTYILQTTVSSRVYKR